MSAAMRKELRCLRALRIAMTRDKDCKSTVHCHNQSTLEGNIKGVYGEIAFEDRYGEPVDESYRPTGDGGVDFEFYIKGKHTTVNVKTASLPLRLQIKLSEVKRCADILVLAKFHLHPYDANKDHAELLGWERREVVLKSEPLLFKNYKELCHWVPRENLLSMKALDELMEDRTDEQGNFR
jgi:hypothetical protein